MKKMIKNKQIKAVLSTDKSAKASNCWNIFAKLHIGEKVLPFVNCTNCDAILFYNSKSGNSSMNRHIQSCKAQPKITSHFKSDIKISIEDSIRLKNAQSIFTIQSGSPFAINNNAGLFALADELIRIGALYGNLKSENILFGRKTITADCVNLSIAKQEKLQRLIASFVPKKNICLASDIWSSRNGDSFLQIQVLYVENFELKVIYYLLKTHLHFKRISAWL